MPDTLIRPLALRGTTLASNLVMAPMAGVSNLPFRLVAREAGAALAFSETVSAKGLVNGGRKTWSLLGGSTAKSASIAVIEAAAPKPKRLPRGLAQLSYFATTRSLEIQTGSGKVIRETR